MSSAFASRCQNLKNLGDLIAFPTLFRPKKKSSAGPVVLLDIPPLQQEVQWNYFSAVRWMYLANEMFDFQTVD